MVVCPIVDNYYQLVTDEVTVISIYISVNGVKSNITSTATLSYDADLGGQKLTIPVSAITATGRFTLCIKSGGNQNYNLDGLIIEDLLSTTIEGSYTFAQVLRILSSVLAGNSAVSGATVTHTGLNGTTARLVAYSDANGRTVSSRNGN
jgi:hypothetical protein